MGRGMTRVKLLCEDRTGRGLFQVIEKATQAARAAAGKAPLGFPRTRNLGLMAGNTKLLEQCAKYTEFRFRSSPPWDHVVYVIDAYRLWDVSAVGIQAPLPNEDMDAYLDGLTVKARAEMERRARGSQPADEWLRIADGFHAHVLVWERESLMLPVSDALGLGPPPPDLRSVRHAADWIDKRHQARAKGRSYEKAIQGPELLEQIANSSALRDRVLAQVQSLRAIVDSLVDLP
jgi:hypothetical protein